VELLVVLHLYGRAKCRAEEEMLGTAPQTRSGCVRLPLGLLKTFLDFL
jgi:hypothetical protein